MNFTEFQRLREQILRERKEVRDCAETNLYRALARLIPPAVPPAESTVHRCHLAEAWAKQFGFPPETARWALVSSGVRHSLALLFQHYAAANAQLWLPQDNYPVYGELARAAGLKPKAFQTLPEPQWPNAPVTPATEILLVTNPLKPLGRWLNTEDVKMLTAWLSASSQRRLLLDAVYTFETRFHVTTLKLLSTGQTLLLHSLTKGWLSPRLFGVALVPEHDLAALTLMFREAPPSQANLSRTRELLAAHADMPSAVAHELDAARLRLFAEMPASLRPAACIDTSGYFTTVVGCWSDLLETTGLLGLPASVFGSTREDITILSSLNFIP